MVDKMYTDTNGITVRKLKELIANWPEEDQYGDETEVWLSTGAYTTSPLIEICPLNKRSSSLTISPGIISGFKSIFH